jgi:hypothetical protein
MKRILSKEKYIFSKILIIVFLINIHFYYRALKKKNYPHLRIKYLDEHLSFTFYNENQFLTLIFIYN